MMGIVVLYVTKMGRTLNFSGCMPEVSSFPALPAAPAEAALWRIRRPARPPCEFHTNTEVPGSPSSGISPMRIDFKLDWDDMLLFEPVPAPMKLL